MFQVQQKRKVDPMGPTPKSTAEPLTSGESPDWSLRTRSEASLPHGSSVADFFGLSWKGCAALLATYSVSSSTVIMSFTFGHLGYISAPLLLGIYFLICCYLQAKILDIAAFYTEVRTLPDLAGAILGPAGRIVMSILQVLNQQFFCPCALLFCAKSLRFLAFPFGSPGNALNCNVDWVLFILLAALASVNALRRFGHVGWLCKVTCTTNVLQVVLICVQAVSHSDANVERRPWPPSSLSAMDAERGHWPEVFSAVSNFAYCYVPCFIATEALQEMQDKSQMRKASVSSTVSMYVLYVIVGLIPVYYWGWNVPQPITDKLEHDWLGISANLTLFLASGVDYIITSISVNQWFQEHVDPTLNVEDWSIKTCVRWFLCSLPSALITFAMCCFVPKLEVMMGIMTSAIAPMSQIIMPATIVFVGARKCLLHKVLQRYEWAILLLSFCAGAFVVCVGLSSTFYYLIHIDFSGDFFCTIVAG